MKDTNPEPARTRRSPGAPTSPREQGAPPGHVTAGPGAETGLPNRETRGCRALSRCAGEAGQTGGRQHPPRQDSSADSAADHGPERPSSTVHPAASHGTQQQNHPAAGSTKAVQPGLCQPSTPSTRTLPGRPRLPTGLRQPGARFLQAAKRPTATPTQRPQTRPPSRTPSRTAERETPQNSARRRIRGRQLCFSRFKMKLFYVQSFSDANEGKVSNTFASRQKTRQLTPRT